MKTNVTNPIVQMEPVILQQLMTEVKETVATDFEMSAKSSSFKAINLWNIRRNGRIINNGSRKKITHVSVTHVSF